MDCRCFLRGLSQTNGLYVKEEAERESGGGMTINQAMISEIMDAYFEFCLRSNVSQRDNADALDKAIIVMLDSHGENDKAMAPFFVDIAKLNTAMGNLEKAESYYEKALSLINLSYGPNHLYTATVLASLAELYAAQGKYSKAETVINRAVATQEKYYGSNHHLIASSWLTKAKVCRIMGKKSQHHLLV